MAGVRAAWTRKRAIGYHKGIVAGEKVMGDLPKNEPRKGLHVASARYHLGIVDELEKGLPGVR